MNKNSMPKKKLWLFTTFIVISSSMPIVKLHIHRQLACLLIGMLLGIFCLSWLNSIKRQKADQFPAACQLSRINNLVACRLPVDATIVTIGILLEKISSKCQIKQKKVTFLYDTTLNGFT
jgi:hypothetical protein